MSCSYVLFYTFSHTACIGVSLTIHHPSDLIPHNGALLIVQDSALIVLHIFNHLKVSEMTSGTGLLKQTALSLTSLRNLLRNLQVFLMRDVDILLSHLAVTHVSFLAMPRNYTVQNMSRWSNILIAVILLSFFITVSFYYLFIIRFFLLALCRWLQLCPPGMRYKAVPESKQ